MVDQARDGSQSAFATLYQQYTRLVHGILLARVPRSEVEDLVQEVFLLAWRRLRSLRDSKAFGGWIAMIARNQAIDYHRKAPQTTELGEAMLQQQAARSGSIGVLETIEACRRPIGKRWFYGWWKG